MILSKIARIVPTLVDSYFLESSEMILENHFTEKFCEESQGDKRILVVDDEIHMVEFLTCILEDEGYLVLSATSAEEALEVFKQYAVPLVITDNRMMGMSGLELVSEIKKLNSSTEIIVITSHASIESAISALRAGAYDYVLKPFKDVEVISAAVKRAYEKFELVRGNRNLIGRLSEYNEQLIKANSRLKEVVNKDGLTNVHNHRYFQEVLSREYLRARRYGLQFAVIFIDLDDFKKINDNYGHLVGDKVLVSVADTISQTVRRVDLVARYGGEEFVLLLPETDEEGAFTCAENIRKNVADLEVINPGIPRSTVSIGVALYDESNDTAQHVVQQADSALYEAKTTGKNRVCFYNSE